MTVVDAKAGHNSYADLDISIVAAAPTKKFAFSLQWLPTGGTPEAGRLDARTPKQLMTLPTQSAARAPR